jgi:ABC-type multidrug transport system fused ATPase/permease subunit
MPKKAKSKTNNSRRAIIWKYLKPYQGEIVVLVTLSLVSAFFHALSPYLAGNIIDGLINPSTTWGQLVLPITSALFFLALWLVIQVIANSADAYLSYKNQHLDERIALDYVVNGIGHLIELPMSFHKEKKMGDIENRLHSAGESLSTIISNIAITLLPQVLSIVIAIFFAFTIQPYMALLLLVAMIGYIIILVSMAPRYTRLARKARKAYGKAYGDAYDAVVNAQSIKQSTAESYEKKRLFRSFHLRALKYWQRTLGIRQIMNSTQRFLVMSTQAIVYMMAIAFITQGKMTVGELVMFNGYIALFLGPFTILSSNWHVIQNGLVTLERAEKVLNEKPEDYNKKDAIILSDIRGKVEYRNVSFDYGKKQKTVLSHISFTANPGEVIALVGESGVGKTTIMDLLGRYFNPTEGEIIIDGRNNLKLDLKFLRSKIAVVPQEILLFNDTIENNIKYGSFKAKHEDIARAARLAHAEHFIEAFPKKYKQVVGERGVKLSVGQKQRIAIARAILRNPRILILDEPTSALDAKSERLVEEALRELMRGRTTFIIAHRLSTVRHADKILVLENGKIAEQGRHEDLVEMNGGIYQKLYSLQIGLKV